MLEIAGIPTEKNKDAKEFVSKVTQLVGITSFNMDQIDVAHQPSERKMASIIVLLRGKNDRNNFKFNFHQIVSDNPLLPENIDQ